jgi:cytochrome b subunit of formate dehydrogenase
MIKDAFINPARRVTHWLMVAVLVVYIVSGYGITQFRVVEALTFGVISKPLSFKVHNGLFITLAALVALHIALALYARARRNPRP